MDMMTARREAFDTMADIPVGAIAEASLAAATITVHDYGLDGTAVPDKLVETVADLLGRATGPGAAVVEGLSDFFDVALARSFHEALFRQVWESCASRLGAEQFGRHDRIKVNTTSDGAIPMELYGSEWSFKDLHSDRDALLFSHLYGPVAGFDGGALLLADVRGFMRHHGLRFADLFDWSVEPTPGSKPVLRAEHVPQVLAEAGIDLGAPGPDRIIFVNNFPDAGILHGVTPVAVTDPQRYVREFHRCSVKRTTRSDP